MNGRPCGAREAGSAEQKYGERGGARMARWAMAERCALRCVELVACAAFAPGLCSRSSVANSAHVSRADLLFHSKRVSAWRLTSLHCRTEMQANVQCSSILARAVRAYLHGQHGIKRFLPFAQNHAAVACGRFEREGRRRNQPHIYRAHPFTSCAWSAFAVATSSVRRCLLRLACDPRRRASLPRPYQGGLALYCRQ